jgi:hypothetical protein
MEQCSEFGRRLEQTAIEKGRRLIGDRNHLGKTRPDLLDLFRGHIAASHALTGVSRRARTTRIIVIDAAPV